jgi:methylmalonyl-CoA mutase
VLDELERISDRGGVLGAMETGYQRGRIQDESMRYEHAKHDGSLPIIGVNTFLGPEGSEPRRPVALARSDDAEKRDQLDRLADFHRRHAADAPAALDRLRDAALAGDNHFDVLMDTVRHCSLGQITDTLFRVGGTYRRNV